MKARAQLRLHAASVECGGAATGEATWWDNGAHHRFEVVLSHVATGRGDRERVEVSRQVLGDRESGRVSFRLDVPPDGPVTYDGELLRLHWQVNLTVALGWVSVAGAELAVVPRGWPPR